MAFFKSLAGPGYVILNVVRVMNIVVLLAVAAACTVMLVKISLNNSFFFFEAATLVIHAFICFFLIVTELNIFRRYFNHHWPLFAQDSGLVTLGAAMVLLGVATLGNLNNEALSEEEIGGPFWRIVLAGGIVAIIFGVINFVLSFIFRDKEIGVTARHIRAHGAVAANQAMNQNSSQKPFHLGHNDLLSSTYRSSRSSSAAGSLRGAQRFPVKVSSPMNEPKSPVSPLTAPDLTYHPAMYSNRV